MIKKIVHHLKWKLKYWRNITLPQLYYANKLPGHVLSGTFAGMNYIHTSTGSVVLPKIVGTYEDELHFIWSEIENKQYDLFVDIGAAEGYYAVGLTKYVFRNQIKTVAFELTDRGRKQVKKLASINGINNLTILGACNVDNLQPVIENKRCFILMDVEGFEFYLLDQIKLDYSSSDILVEIHPNAHPHLEQTIISRFSGSHHIQVIHPQPKVLPDTIQLPGWAIDKKDYLMNEFRGPQSWLWIRSKQFIENNS